MFRARQVGIYLCVTFGGGWLIAGLVLLAGLRLDTDTPDALAANAMYLIAFLPAIGALVATRFGPGEGLAALDVRVGRQWPYLAAWLIVPALAAVAYLLTWLIRSPQPDWTLSAMREMVDREAGGQPTTVSEAWTLSVLNLLLLAPVTAALHVFAEETGWRGFLLPRLLVMGRGKALLLTGMLRGLYLAPLVMAGLFYPDRPLAGMGLIIIQGMVLGVILGELRLRYRSTILAAWTMTLVSAHLLEGRFFWQALLPGTDPLIGGLTGAVGLVVMGGAALALFLLGRSGALPEGRTGLEPTDMPPGAPLSDDPTQLGEPAQPAGPPAEPATTATESASNNDSAINRAPSGNRPDRADGSTDSPLHRTGQ